MSDSLMEFISKETGKSKEEIEELEKTDALFNAWIFYYKVLYGEIEEEIEEWKGEKD